MFISSKKFNQLINGMKNLTSAIERMDRATLIIEKENDRLSNDLASTIEKLTDNDETMGRIKNNIEKLGISYEFISRASDVDIEVSRILIDIKINKDGLKNPSFANDLQRKSALSIVRKFFIPSQKSKS